MMKERVYLDSTIPSYYFEERDSLRLFSDITRDWWDEMSQEYGLYISEEVLREVSLGEYPNRQKVVHFTSQIAMLESVPAIANTAEFYIQNKVMPNSLIGDAFHLAYASFYGLEYLLTWNCNHLANANKKKHIRVINVRLGLGTPEIVTPLELFKEKD